LFAETGLCDQSTLATDELFKVGICSEGMDIAESLPLDVGNVATNEVGAKSECEPVDCKNQPENRADSEISKDDNILAIEIALGDKESTETSRSFDEEKITPFEGNNVEEPRTSANKDGSESGARVFEDKNIKIGEAEESDLHEHVSNVLRKTFSGNNFDTVSNFECSAMYDETAIFGTLANSAN